MTFFSKTIFVSRSHGSWCWKWSLIRWRHVSYPASSDLRSIILSELLSISIYDSKSRSSRHLSGLKFQYIFQDTHSMDEWFIGAIQYIDHVFLRPFDVQSVLLNITICSISTFDLGMIYFSCRDDLSWTHLRTVNRYNSDLRLWIWCNGGK